jgi:MraZ protein
MVFTGTFELTIDPKNRLSVPALIRSAIDPERDGTRFYLVPGTPKTTLSLYADRYFERYADAYHASLDPNEQSENFEKVFYAMATLLDLDKQGRMLLPQWILDRVAIGKQVTVTGARDHLVIWNRAEYAAFMKQNWDRYPDLLQRARLETALNRRNGGPPTGS